MILEGDPFNGQKLKDSLNTLKRLGYFKSVDVNILKTDTPGVIDIELKVVENLTGRFHLVLDMILLKKLLLLLAWKKNFWEKVLKLEYQSIHRKIYEI